MSESTEQLFHEMWVDYYDKVNSYIYARVSDYHTAEDLTSEVFFRCYKSIERYDPERASASTWIFTITKNLLKNYYRDKKPSVSIDGMEGFDLPYEDDFDRAIRLEEIKNFLDEAMAGLDETKVRLLKMRFYDEMKTKDIAEKLELTEVNVRVMLSRTLKQLNVYVEGSDILQVL